MKLALHECVCSAAHLCLCDGLCVKLFYAFVLEVEMWEDGMVGRLKEFDLHFLGEHRQVEL